MNIYEKRTKIYGVEYQYPASKEFLDFINLYGYYLESECAAPDMAFVRMRDKDFNKLRIVPDGYYLLALNGSLTFTIEPDISYLHIVGETTVDQFKEEIEKHG